MGQREGLARLKRDDEAAADDPSLPLITPPRTVVLAGPEPGAQSGAMFLADAHAGPEQPKPAILTVKGSAPVELLSYSAPDDQRAVLERVVVRQASSLSVRQLRLEILVDGRVVVGDVPPDEADDLRIEVPPRSRVEVRGRLPGVCNLFLEVLLRGRVFPTPPPRTFDVSHLTSARKEELRKVVEAARRVHGRRRGVRVSRHAWEEMRAQLGGHVADELVEAHGIGKDKRRPTRYALRLRVDPALVRLEGVGGASCPTPAAPKVK